MFLQQLTCLLIACHSAPHGQESGEHLDSQWQASPRHCHASRNTGHELGAPIHALHVCRIIETIARIPAVFSNAGLQIICKLRQLLRIIRPLQSVRQFCRGLQILIVEAIEHQVGGGEERTPESGRVIIVADGDVVSPHQQAQACLIPQHPRVVEAL